MAQRTEQIPPEPGAQVRFLPGAPKENVDKLSLVGFYLMRLSLFFVPKVDKQVDKPYFFYFNRA